MEIYQLSLIIGSAKIANKMIFATYEAAKSKIDNLVKVSTENNSRLVAWIDRLQPNEIGKFESVELMTPQIITINA